MGDLVTKITAVGVTDVTTPMCTRVLDDTFGGDHDLTGYARRCWPLPGRGVTEHILSFDHGAAGADGKSTLINVVMSVLGIGGNGYAN